MNNLFPLNLAADFVCDRFLEEDAFEETTNRTALVLVGASHLGNLARFLDTQEWQVHDLTTPGWRISDHSVELKTQEIVNLSEHIDLEKSTVILQLSTTVFLWLAEQGAPRTSLYAAMTANTTLLVSWWWPTKPA